MKWVGAVPKRLFPTGSILDVLLPISAFLELTSLCYAAQVGDIEKVTVRLDYNTGTVPSWKLELIKVVELETGEHWEFKPANGVWLSKTHGLGHTEYTLDMPLTYDILP